MVVTQGDIFWVDLREPIGSEAGFRRPVVVVQGDALNRSRIATVVCVPLTTNLRLASGHGNVLLAAGNTGLAEDSVANVSQLLAVDRRLFLERVGHLSGGDIERVFKGIDIVLGR